MVANNSVTIIMIVMSYLMVAVVVAAFFMHGPRALDERKNWCLVRNCWPMPSAATATIRCTWPACRPNMTPMPAR